VLLRVVKPLGDKENFMAVKGIPSNAIKAWDDPQERSNQYLKQKQTLHYNMDPQLASGVSTISSMKPDDEIEQSKVIASATPIKEKKDTRALAWVETNLKNLVSYLGWKSEPVEQIGVQQDYVKKSKAVAVGPVAKPPAINANADIQADNIPQVSGTEAKAGFFDTIIEWIKDKWNSFLEFIGVRKPAAKTIEKDRTKRAKIQERHSNLDIEDDFKYLDITLMDPLRVMLAVLVKQGELREEQVLLIQQKILHMQEDLKELHEQRMKIHADLAEVGKRAGVLDKVGIVITVGQVIGGIALTAGVVAGAAAIATLGAAAPAAAIIGVVAAILNGITYAFKAFHTWLTADTKEKMDKLQGEMLTKTAARDEMQFQMKADVENMERIFKDLIGHSETGSALLSAQYGK
jgi:hypothetical protein